MDHQHKTERDDALGEQSHDERARDLVFSVSQPIHRHVPLGLAIEHTIDISDSASVWHH
jgi:hypothetical protein